MISKISKTYNLFYQISFRLVSMKIWLYLAICFVSFFAEPVVANGIDKDGGIKLSELGLKGEKLFLHYCAQCHGITGSGDGFNAEYMDKEPAELSDHDFIAKKANRQLFRVIKLGGAGVKKSPFMPGYGNTLSEEQIWQLVAYIRYLAEDDSHKVTVPSDASRTAPSSSPINYEMISDFSQWFSQNGRDQEVIKLGERLFLKKKGCFACHQLNDEGGIVGPDLSRAGFLYTPEWLFTWIRNPQFIKPNTKMPNIGLVEEEDRAISAFLSSLPGEAVDIPEEWTVYEEIKGDPKIGRDLFFDSEGIAYCGKCHRVNEKGGKVGPDLSYVGTTRSFRFMLESILEPKAVITVGFSSVLILTKQGKFLTGVKTNEDDSSIDIVNKEGDALHIFKDKIKKFKTQKISIMPGNFRDILSNEDIRNLLAYLETLRIPQMEKSSVNSAE